MGRHKKSEIMARHMKLNPDARCSCGFCGTITEVQLHCATRNKIIHVGKMRNFHGKWITMSVQEVT